MARCCHQIIGSGEDVWYDSLTEAQLARDWSNDDGDWLAAMTPLTQTFDVQVCTAPCGCCLLSLVNPSQSPIPSICIIDQD
jgi:hypothetical protein